MFTKGKSGNPKGRPPRPRTFEQLRKLALTIACETATRKGEPVALNGKSLTVAEAILRTWAQSSVQKHQEAFLEHAYGRPPVLKPTSAPLPVSIPTGDLPDQATKIITLVSNGTLPVDSALELLQCLESVQRVSEWETLKARLLSCLPNPPAIEIVSDEDTLSDSGE